METQRITYEDYDKIKAIRSSELAAIEKSPVHLKTYREKEEEETKSLNFGRIYHALLLEGRKIYASELDAFGEETPNRRKKEYKEWKKSVGNVLKADEERELLAMKEMMVQSGTLEKMSNMEKEVTVLFERQGMDCKARLDAYSKKQKRIIDLKTTRSCDERFLRSSIFRYGYHRQAAWYLYCFPDYEFTFVFQEKEAPYGIRLVMLEDSIIDREQKKIDSILQTHKDRVAFPSKTLYDEDTLIIEDKMEV